MNILDKIVAHKAEELVARKKTSPEAECRDSEFFMRKCLSMKANLLKEYASGIIAEFKRKSPSKGFINQHADAAAVVAGYAEAGASGVSILTDHTFFGGSNEDLLSARKTAIPILRKDFIIDPYQLTEAKAIGADVVLLIAACLSKMQVQELASYAKDLGMEILLELHDVNELDHVCEEIDIVGINNRDLKTFKVDIQRAIELSRQLPYDKIKIAESGINDSDTMVSFKKAGYKGFLVGEHFMREPDPAEALRVFLSRLKTSSYI